MANKYQYPHLDPSLRTIRLLRLLSRSTRTDIQCELTHCYLDHPKVYDAISYSWGSTAMERSRDFPITLDGQKFMVSLVVFDILLRLHNPKEDMLLWLDLICIDQDSISDRELQVTRMAEIFRTARRAIVSLGLHSETNVMSVQQVWHTFVGRMQILQHPWFRRVWVVQEMAFAADVLVICGRLEKSGSWFVETLRVQRSKPFGDFGANEQELVEHKALLDMMASKKPIRPQLSLAACLQTFRSFQATLPADKVYALLELCEESWRIDVNYSMSRSQIFISIAWKILEKTCSLDILCCREPRRKSELTSGLPSWVPDWTKHYPHPEHVFELDIESTDLLDDETAVRGIAKKLWKAAFSREHKTSLHTQKDISHQKQHPNLHIPTLLAMNTRLVVYGNPIADITSIFNDGSIEIRLWTGLETAPRICIDKFDHPASFAFALSGYLSSLHERLMLACGQGLEPDDHVCVLRGSTGLVILRRWKRSDYQLVSLDHSQYRTYGSVWDGYSRRGEWRSGDRFAVDQSDYHFIVVSGLGYHAWGSQKLFGQPLAALDGLAAARYSLF